MSSSLFDNWGSSYESYPDTDYVKGDKKFGELKKGNILYVLSEDLDGNYQWEELIITNPREECERQLKNINDSIHDLLENELTNNLR